MIRVSVLQNNPVNVSLSVPTAQVRVSGQTVVITDGERYAGEYEVIPDFDTQILETENKLMTDDVTVHPIPVHRTTNPYGTTVYIGGLLDG